MKKCSFCGTPWEGFSSQPRERERCPTCRRHYHCCSNCKHFDSKQSSSCQLKHTEYVGPRDLLNYCEEFRMIDTREQAREAKTASARSRWDQLFSR